MRTIIAPVIPSHGMTIAELERLHREFAHLDHAERLSVVLAVQAQSQQAIPQHGFGTDMPIFTTP